MKDLKRMYLFKKLVKSLQNQHHFGTPQISEVTFQTLSFPESLCTINLLLPVRPTEHSSCSLSYFRKYNADLIYVESYPNKSPLLKQHISMKILIVEQQYISQLQHFSQWSEMKWPVQQSLNFYRIKLIHRLILGFSLASADTIINFFFF